MSTPVMRPVFQTLFGAIGAPGPERGNCFPACVATLMAIDLADVPHWYSADAPVHDHWQAILGWLQARGWTYWGLEWPLHPDTHRTLAGAVVIVSGVSPRFPGSQHAVVARLADPAGWELVHDPHPDGNGITGAPTMVELLIPYVRTDGAPG